MDLRVAVKTIVVVHRLLQRGRILEELLNFTQRGHILQISNFKDDSSPVVLSCMEVVISSSLWLSLVFPGSEHLHDGTQQSQSQGDKSRDGLISISHVKMIGKSTGVILLHDNVNFMPSMLDDCAWCQPAVLCKGVG